MDSDCIEVIDLAGTEQDLKINNKSILSKRLLSKKNMSKIEESTVTKHDLQKSKNFEESKSITKKNKCPHKKHKKRRKDSSFIENTICSSTISSKSKSLDKSSTFELESQIEQDRQMYYSKKKRKHHHKTCKRECKDDASVILTSNSVPKPILEAKSVKNNNKRRVKLGSMTHCNMQDLVITQDVELKQKKHKCFIEVNMNILSDTAVVHRQAINRHKFMHCTVPKERIRPQCLRRNCSQHCHLVNNNKKRDGSGNSISQTINFLTSCSQTSMSSNLLYEDISTDSLRSSESDEEIDTLIKRARERERKSMKKRRTKRKRLRTSTPLDVWTSDVLSDVSEESIPTSIHSRVTMVVEAVDYSVYSPTSFSPLTTTFDFDIGDPQEFIDDLQFNENMIYDIPLPSMTPEHFKGYSAIDATQKVVKKGSGVFVDTVKDNRAAIKIEPESKIDAVTVSEHIVENTDNAVIDTSTLSSPPKIKTEKLDGESDIYFIK